MDTVFEAITSTFPFSKLMLTSPLSIPGKPHFCKLSIDKKPVFMQSPKCKTKQGIIKSGKKMYTDLVFTNFDEDLMEWIEALETSLRQILFVNKEKWFDITLSEDDIESYFNPSIKLFKSGKLFLLRAGLNSAVRIYDENEDVVELTAITDSTELITILEFTGITCSSKSFQLDIEIKQIMVCKPAIEVFNKCLIKTGGKQSAVTPSSELSVSETPKTEAPKIEAPKIELTKTEALESIHEPLAQDTELKEYEFQEDDLAKSDTMQLKEKTEVYYELYREARRKAKLAKSLALSSFLEAKRIKNLYMLDDIDSDESDIDELEDYMDDYDTLE